MQLDSNLVPKAYLDVVLNFVKIPLFCCRIHLCMCGQRVAGMSCNCSTLPTQLLMSSRKKWPVLPRPPQTLEICTWDYCMPLKNLKCMCLCSIILDTYLVYIKLFFWLHWWVTYQLAIGYSLSWRERKIECLASYQDFSCCLIAFLFSFK